MWEQAAAAIKGWIDAGLEPLPVSINISRVHLGNDRFVKILDGIIAKYDKEIERKRIYAAYGRFRLGLLLSKYAEKHAL